MVINTRTNLFGSNAISSLGPNVQRLSNIGRVLFSRRARTVFSCAHICYLLVLIGKVHMIEIS